MQLGQGGWFGLVLRFPQQGTLGQGAELADVDEDSALDRSCGGHGRRLIGVPCVCVCVYVCLILEQANEFGTEQTSGIRRSNNGIMFTM